MLKAIQFLGSSSEFAAYRWKPVHFAASSCCCCCCCCFVPKLSSYSTSRTRPENRFLAHATRPIRLHSTRSESKMDGTSSSSSASVAVQSAGVRKIKFCQWCGGQTKHEVPDGEEKLRAICTNCGRIAYQNPKMLAMVTAFVKALPSKTVLVIQKRYGVPVVGCLIEHDNKVLLCKRNIEPSHGLWTLPAGYLEMGESAAEGAIRETWEEACAEVEVVSPFAQLDIPLIGQTYIIFLAKMKKPHFSPGPESSECRLFSRDEIPFDSLAFSSMLVTLNLYTEDVKTGRLKFHYGTINKRPGTSPSDIRAYTLDSHLLS